jgi:hypothetical protein
MSGMRDKLVVAIFELAGLGFPFDDMRPVRDQLIIKHHGTLGDCLEPSKCGACDAVMRDMEALASGKHVALSAAQESFERRERDSRPYNPIANLPDGIDPRSPAALAFAESEYRRLRGED